MLLSCSFGGRGSGCVSAEHVRAVRGCPSEGTGAAFCMQIWKSGGGAPVPCLASYFVCQVSSARPDVCVSPAQQGSGAAVLLVVKRCLMFEVSASGS